jgi:signal transduction histidine kinase/HAMP domain-containing protein
VIFRQKVSLGAWTVATAVAVGACCAVTLMLLASSIHGLRRATNTAAGTANAIAAANRIQQSAFAVQGAELGFVASGDPAFTRHIDALASAHDSDLAELADRLRAYEQKRFRLLDIAMNRLVWGWAVPQIALARSDRAGAQAYEATHEGLRRLAVVQSQMALIRAYEQKLENSQVKLASVDSHRTTVIAVVGFSLVMLIAFLYVAFMRGFVVAPIHRLLASMRQVGDGDRRERTVESGLAEIGSLQRGFNEMATSIDNQRGRAERANAGLADALRHAGSETRRIERLFGLAERLVGETDASAAAAVIVERIAEAGSADVVSLYAFGSGGDELRVVAAHGADIAALPPSLAVSQGTSGAALAERRVIRTDAAGAPLTNPTLGDDAFRHTLDVPLVHGASTLGVVCVGRRDEAEFGLVDQELIGHMADQGALALSMLFAYAEMLRLGSLNRTLIESSRDGIRLIDVRGAILAENSRMKQLLSEVTSGPASASFWDQAAKIEPLTTDPSAFAAISAELRAKPDAEIVFEYELAHSGQTLSRFVGPVRDESGTQVGRIVILRDVTVERQAQRTKDDFVASVTHELRTPLTSIAGYLELLRDKEMGVLSEEQDHFLEVVDRNATRLLRLVNDLLFIGRLDSGMLDLEPEPTDLVSVIANAVDAAGPSAEDRGVSIALEVDALPEIVADRGRIAQLLDNLLSNAIKFTSRGGRISVHATSTGDTVVLLVSDSGVGVSDEEKEHLFDRFFRASSAIAQAVPGTGLGLAISKAIVDAHAGEITVEDTPGGGTTFRLQLPIGARASVAA